MTLLAVRCCTRTARRGDYFSAASPPTIGHVASLSANGRQVKLTINVFYDEGRVDRARPLALASHSANPL